MKSARNLALILFFVGLATLEITHGLFRLKAVREKQRQGLLEGIESAYRDLAGEVQSALAEKDEHVAYLAASPAVRDVLVAPSNPTHRSRLKSLVLPYLVAFRGIDRFRLLGDDGRELFRCERIGEAVGVLPESLLATEPDRGILKLVESLPSGEVAVSPLMIDRERVEVPESDRQVLHYVAKVDADQDRCGILVLTVYARPLLSAVRRFAPMAEVSAVLVDARGRFLSGTGGQPDLLEQQQPANLFEEHVQAASQLLSGAERVEIEGLTYWGLPVQKEPRWLLICRIPERVSEKVSADVRGEYLWIIGSTVTLTAVLALAAAFLVRMSVREFRLREQSRYLERIRRESEKYRALMEGAADMILIVDPATGVIRESNAMAREYLPLPSFGPDSNGSKLRSPPSLETVLVGTGLDRLHAALPAASGGRRMALSDIRVRDRNGRELNVDARLTAIDLEEARVVEVSLRDLTRQKELERRLRMSERLGSLGLLTAGVAHEINNPLEGIGNYLALLDREHTAKKRKSYLELVRHGFERIRDIVSELASFTRLSEDSGNADIAQVIHRALSMVRYNRQFRHVDVKLIGLEEQLYVAGESGRLEQVFINLLLNAAGATKKNGCITVKADRVRKDMDASVGTENGSVVEVVVEDDGPGIPEEDLARVFDPFFTRSDTGNRLGLGLFISYGIVDAHNGTLSAENRPEGGARFVIRFPAVESCGERPLGG